MPTLDPVATMIAFASIARSPLDSLTRICVGEALYRRDTDLRSGRDDDRLRVDRALTARVFDADLGRGDERAFRLDELHLAQLQ
ncbi:MAG TPA: hypothetical protein VM052_01585, partial [Candidatus Limnocylindrales bacterium]|nr:hypothetical protein [Candidatus Limnocylindrales bacterium]